MQSAGATTATRQIAAAAGLLAAIALLPMQQDVHVPRCPPRTICLFATAPALQVLQDQLGARQQMDLQRLKSQIRLCLQWTGQNSCWQCQRPSKSRLRPHPQMVKGEILVPVVLLVPHLLSTSTNLTNRNIVCDIDVLNSGLCRLAPLSHSGVRTACKLCPDRSSGPSHRALELEGQAIWGQWAFEFAQKGSTSACCCGVANLIC